jgi:hypothetical protein
MGSGLGCTTPPGTVTAQSAVVGPKETEDSDSGSESQSRPRTGYPPHRSVLPPTQTLPPGSRSHSDSAEGGSQLDSSIIPFHSFMNDDGGGGSSNGARGSSVSGSLPTMQRINKVFRELAAADVRSLAAAGNEKSLSNGSQSIEDKNSSGGPSYPLPIATGHVDGIHERTASALKVLGLTSNLNTDANGVSVAALPMPCFPSNPSRFSTIGHGGTMQTSADRTPQLPSFEPCSDLSMRSQSTGLAPPPAAIARGSQQQESVQASASDSLLPDSTDRQASAGVLCEEPSRLADSQRRAVRFVAATAALMTEEGWGIDYSEDSLYTEDEQEHLRRPAEQPQVPQAAIISREPPTNRALREAVDLWIADVNYASGT